MKKVILTEEQFNRIFNEGAVNEDLYGLGKSVKDALRGAKEGWRQSRQAYKQSKQGAQASTPEWSSTSTGEYPKQYQEQPAQQTAQPTQQPTQQPQQQQGKQVQQQPQPTQQAQQQAPQEPQVNIPLTPELIQLANEAFMRVKENFNNNGKHRSYGDVGRFAYAVAFEILKQAKSLKYIQ